MRSLKCCGILCVLFLCSVPTMAAEKGDSLPFVPSSLELLPPPPADDSATFLRDKEVYQQTRRLKDSVRWKLAQLDADLKLEENAGAWFEDSFGLRLSKQQTPAVYALMEAMNKHMRKANRSAKDKYQRARPFVLFKEQGTTCAPHDEERLSKDGSYPSGHSARGWGMALLLAELSPERQGAILQRGYEIGQSRVVCGFHWQSDVDAGRLVASAVTTQMHNDPKTAELITKAKDEVRQLRAQSQGK